MDPCRNRLRDSADVYMKDLNGGGWGVNGIVVPSAPNGVKTSMPTYVHLLGFASAVSLQQQKMCHFSYTRSYQSVWESKLGSHRSQEAPLLAGRDARQHPERIYNDAQRPQTWGGEWQRGVFSVTAATLSHNASCLIKLKPGGPEQCGVNQQQKSCS